MATDREKKAAIERLTKRIVMHGKKTGSYISEESARKRAVETQKDTKLIQENNHGHLCIRCFI